jgi:hypothetical protein
MSGARDYRVEIHKGRPQGVTGIKFEVSGGVESELDLPLDPAPEVVDVTHYVELDGFGSINRALDRDLLSFKTGDLILSFDNQDGFFDELFALFGPTDIWSVRVFRRGEVQFWGCIVGLGSIVFDRKEKSVEFTAYGLTKILDLTDAGLVRRAFPIFTVTTATGGASTLTLNSTIGLLSGDVLHLTDHVNSEDVTVKQVTSATVVSLQVALAHSYAAGLEVTVNTKGRRYKSIEYLVGYLFKAAFIGMAELRLSPSQFRNLAPTPVNISGLSIANNPRRGISKLALTYGSGYGRCMVAVAGVDSYTQENPDEDWIVQGLPNRGPYDWSPYFKQDGSIPQFLLYEPDATESGVPSERFHTWSGGADYFSSPVRIWGWYIDTTPALSQRTSNDGNTWNAPTHIALPGGPTALSEGERCAEYDPVRHHVFAAWKVNLSSTRNFQYYDVDAGSPAWVDCKQADDNAADGYFGPRYIRDLDYTLVLRGVATGIGPTFEICAFRGAARLWKRPFPGCFIAPDATTEPIAGNSFFYPTRTARYVNGRIYMVLVSDGAVQLLWTDDEFQTYTMRKVVPGTTNTILMAARVVDNYRFFSYIGSEPRGYFIAAPYYAGVIDYADFEGLSAAEALKLLAVLSNAFFWVDDDAQGHFVARDLFDPGAVTDIADRLMEESDTLLWEETAQYVKVSGGSVEATAGNAAFAAEGITLDSPFIPNEAFAQALADAYQLFYSAARQYVESGALDPDGRIYRPLDRVTLGAAERFLVYESDHDLVNDEVALTLLEER